MPLIKTLLENKQFRALALVGIVLGTVTLAVAWKLGFGPQDLKVAWKATETFLQANQWAMFLALVILPALPVPMSALLLVAAAVWGPTWQGCSLVVLALAVNLTWTYWVAAYPARNLIEKMLTRTSITIPNPSTSDQVQLILLLRLTPGIPFFLHNYILGFLRPPFALYLVLSTVLSGAVAVGIVLTGGALFQGKGGTALLGAFILVLAVVVIRLVRKRIARNAPLDDSPEPPPTDPAADI